MFRRVKINMSMPPGPGDEMLSLWGEIAERIADDMEKNGGFVGKNNL